MNIEKFTDTLYQKDEDGLVTLTLNRPQKKNSINGRTILELWWAVDHFENDDSAYALVITGTENYGDKGIEKNAFCSGADFVGKVDFSDLTDEEKAPHDPTDIALKGLVLKMNQMSKPVIAAMNGYGIGVGFTLPLACADLVYMAETAYLKLPFVGLGIIPELASTYLLPRIVGLTKANEMFFFGEPVSAQEALELGLCNGIYPLNEVVEKAKAQARRLMPPTAALNSIKQTKRAVRAPLLKEMEAALDRENIGLRQCTTSPDFAEAITAQMQRRAPQFPVG